MLVSEVLVAECHGGSADGVEVGDVGGHGLREGGEWRGELDITEHQAI